MQDRYVGDVGDFGKYALLKALAGDELRLGVHWYLNADEERNTDGKFTDYQHLRQCDPTLFDTLQDLVRSGRRSVVEVESARILPVNTVFYSLPLPSGSGRNRVTRRAAWNARALDVLAGADFVFMDPDNGLTRRPSSLMGAAAAKYVSLDEVGPYFRRGNSLIIYHHQTREKGGLAVTIPQRFALLRSLGCERPWAFVFRRISVRVYFIMPTQAHVNILARLSTQFLKLPGDATNTFNSNSRAANGSLSGGGLPDNLGYDFHMSKNSSTTDFPYPFPVFLSPVLRILADGHEHGVDEIREQIAREFALTPEQLTLRRRVAFPTVFVNKVALAFMRLIIHKAIVPGSPQAGSYRITAHGLGILKRHPTDARERDL